MEDYGEIEVALFLCETEWVEVIMVIIIIDERNIIMRMAIAVIIIIFMIIYKRGDTIKDVCLVA